MPFVLSCLSNTFLILSLPPLWEYPLALPMPAVMHRPIVLVVCIFHVARRLPQPIVSSALSKSIALSTALSQHPQHFACHIAYIALPLSSTYIALLSAYSLALCLQPVPYPCTLCLVLGLCQSHSISYIFCFVCTPEFALWGIYMPSGFQPEGRPGVLRRPQNKKWTPLDAQILGGKGNYFQLFP